MDGRGAGRDARFLNLGRGGKGGGGGGRGGEGGS